VVHQNPSHHLRRHTEKMRAILPGHALLADQAQVRFVYQSGGLECVVAPFPPEIGGRAQSQLVVHQREQFLPRLKIASTPGAKQTGSAVGLVHGAEFLGLAPVESTTTSVGFLSSTY